jgi:aryl-alcohol dehydrogenase-like predicted oxidoreductase
MKVHPISAVQSEYSLWTRDAEKSMLNACRELGVTFVAYCPLGRGMLTGKVNGLDGLEATDFRRRLPRFANGALEKNLELVRTLDTFATRYSATPAQIALAWLLCKHPHVVPIPGTKRVRNALENAAAIRVKLPKGEISELDALFAPSAVTGDRYPPPAMQGIERA